MSQHNRCTILEKAEQKAGGTGGRRAEAKTQIEEMLVKPIPRQPE